MRKQLIQTFTLVLVALTAAPTMAQEADSGQAKATAEIEAAIQSYANAFNERDVATLVKHWSPDGVYISRDTGDSVTGHEALTTEFTTIFEQESIPKLAVSTDSIDFVSPNVAIETGTATITHSEEEVVDTAYSVVYVKRDGAWLIDRVTEEEIVVEFSNYDKLQDLEFLIGDWTVERDDLTIQLSYQWTKNQNFISQTYRVENEGEVESSGLQVIGWDPANEQICSWLFDSDGGFIKGTWTPREDSWSIQSIATLADGGKGSFTTVIKPQDDNSYTWTKLNRVLDGELLPNIDEILVQRQ